MSWRRILVVASLLAIATMGIFVAPLARDAVEARRARQAAEPKPIPATDSQQAAIVRALLLGLDHKAYPPAVADGVPAPVAEDWPLLVDRTIMLRSCSHTASGSASCTSDLVMNDPTKAIELEIYEYRDIPLKLRRELALANARSSAQPSPGIDGVRLVPTIDGFRPIANDGFFKAHPGAAGIVQVSRAVLTEDGARALIYVEHDCGSWCKSGFLFVLERRGGEWVIAGRFLHYIT